MEKEQRSGWKIIAIVSMALLLLVSGLYATEKAKSKNSEAAAPAETVEPVEEQENWLSLWSEDARAKNELEAFIKTVTDENSPDFIPVEDRVAVFDLDGTLFCETDPIYFDHMLFVLEHILLFLL